MPQPKLDSPVIFISDVHLGGFSPSKNRRIEYNLLTLIDYCEQNDINIALLGDLFDYWMEYPNYIPNLGQQVLNRFQQFNKRLGTTLFITGNHDYWTRTHLQNLGFYVEPDYYRGKIGGKRLMALHGDGLSDNDYGLPRRKSHKFIRNELFIDTYQSLIPPKAGITIMKYFSRLSRFCGTESGKKERLDHWAEKQLTHKNIDLILCGHDHHPRKKQFSFGTYINLGTFYSHHTMVLYNNDEASLVCWNARKKTINLFKTT